MSSLPSVNDDLKNMLRQAEHKLVSMRQHRLSKGHPLAEPTLTSEEIDTLLTCVLFSDKMMGL